MNNLGPLKEKAAKLFESWLLETIVGLVIEKCVVEAKRGKGIMIVSGVMQYEKN